MADRWYRLLLQLLPGWFRQEFAGEMVTVFRHEREVSAGGTAIVALWSRTVRDVLALAWRLHSEALAQDVTYALRTLRKTPAFTLAAIGTLAVGLGPTVVIANFLYQVLIAPLPFPEPDRLVRVWNARPEREQTRVPLSTPDYVDFRARQTSFDAFAAHTGTSVAMVIGQTPRQVLGVLTSSDLHRVLGTHALLGRDLSESDMAPGAPPVVVLGPALWRSEFAARRDVIGEMVKIDGQPTTVIGVLSEGPDFPLGTANLWVPLTLDPANQTRGTHYLTATGRLKKDVSIEQAEDSLNGIASGLAASYPDTNKGKTVELFGLKEQLNGDSPRLLGVLAAAIGAVLLIACLNVASLLTVRATARRSELAVRTALGATGRRLRRQLMVEHVVLTLGGGLVAAAIGVALHRAIIETRVLQLPRTAAVFGWQAIAVLAVLVVTVGAMFAAIAARRGSASALASTLLATIRQTDARQLIRFRQLLVGAEIGAALVLLVTAGLLLQSAQRLANVDPGFRTEGVLTFGVVLPGHDYMEPPKRIGFADRVTEGLHRLPGVRDVAIAGYAPMGEMRATRRFAPTDRPLPASGNEPVALDMPVGPEYFRVMGIPLISGRMFETRDSADAAPVIIISEEFGRRTFGSESPIGKQIRFFSSRPGGTPPPAREIVGVVGNVRQDGVRDLPFPQMYVPYAQNAWGFLSFFLLVDGNPDGLRASIQRVVNEVDPLRPARDVLTTREIVSSSTARHRTITWMFLGLAAVALLLATVGLYGVSATAAAQRSRELAIRAAIGADPAMLLRLVIGQGLVTAVIGILAGIAGSVAVTKGLGTLLYEVRPQDPLTIGLTTIGLLAVATAASYLPARRTLAQNPAEVLRAD